MILLIRAWNWSFNKKVVNLLSCKMMKQKHSVLIRRATTHRLLQLLNIVLTMELCRFSKNQIYVQPSERVSVCTVRFSKCAYNNQCYEWIQLLHIHCAGKYTTGHIVKVILFNWEGGKESWLTSNCHCLAHRKDQLKNCLSL